METDKDKQNSEKILAILREHDKAIDYALNYSRRNLTYMTSVCEDLINSDATECFKMVWSHGFTFIDLPKLTESCIRPKPFNFQSDDISCPVIKILLDNPPEFRRSKPGKMEEIHQMVLNAIDFEKYVEFQLENPFSSNISDEDLGIMIIKDNLVGLEVDQEILRQSAGAKIYNIIRQNKHEINNLFRARLGNVLESCITDDLIERDLRELDLSWVGASVSGIEEFILDKFCKDLGIAIKGALLYGRTR